MTLEMFYSIQPKRRFDSTRINANCAELKFINSPFLFSRSFFGVESASSNSNVLRMKLIFVAYIFAVADPGLIKENFPSKVVSEEVFDAHWSIVALNIEYDFRTLEEDIPDMLSDRTAKRTLDPTVNQWLSQLGFKLVESF